MQKSLIRKILVLGIIVLFFGASISLSASISHPFGVHQNVYGFIEYSDGSWVPNDVIVTITNVDEDESATVLTWTSISGHTGAYFFDVYDIDAENGHTIKVNVSYGGCTGNNSIIVNTNQGPSIRCNVTIYGNYSDYRISPHLFFSFHSFLLHLSQFLSRYEHLNLII